MSLLLRRHYHKQEKAVASMPSDLQDKTLEELKALAKANGLKGYSKLNHEDLVALLGGT